MEHTLVRATCAVATVVLSGLATAVAGQSADPCEPQRVIAPVEIPASDYGFRVSTNGHQWFVSDPNASTLCPGSSFECGAGAVFVYDLVDGRLVHAQTVVPPDVGLYDAFGIGMDVDGDRMIIGAYRVRWPGSDLRRGVAYIYEFDGSQWTEAARIQPPPEVEERFGLQVSIEGDTAIVKPATLELVYHYQFEGGLWTLFDTIVPPDGGVSGNCFGCTRFVRDDWFFIAAYQDSAQARDGGSVYAYRRQPDDSLEFVQKIDDADVGWFGAGLDFDGETLAIGAPFTERLSLAGHRPYLPLRR